MAKKPEEMTQDELIEEVNKARKSEGKSLEDITKMSEEAKKARLEALQIEMKVAKAIGETSTQLEGAAEAYKLLEKIPKDDLIQRAEAERQIAEATGMTAMEVRKLKEEYDALGSVGMNALKKSEKGFMDVGTKIGIVSRSGQRLLGNIAEIGQMANSPKGIAGMTKAFKETFKPSMLAANALVKITESTIAMFHAVDQASVSFARSTGFGKEFTAEIFNAAAANRNLGLTAKGTADAFAIGRTELSNFNLVSEEAREKFAVNAAGLQKLGVALSDTAMIVEDFRKRFGMSVEEATDVTTDLAMAASKLGVQTGKFVKQYQAAQKQLAVYGKTGIKVFKNLAAAAKAAGVETESLLGLAGKFDTFSDAAETTGKLNAILGTQMSSMDLLTMKEDERIEYLLRNIQTTGKSFSQMDKFTQKAIAQAAGITDMAEAQRIFGMSFKDYKQHQRDVQKQADAQKELEEKMKDTMTAVEKIKQAFMNLAIPMAPLIDDIASIAQGFLDFSQRMNGVPALVLFGASALTVFAPAVTIAGTAIKTLTTGIYSSVTAMGSYIISKIKGTAVTETLSAAEKKEIVQKKLARLAAIEAAMAQDIDTGSKIKNTTVTDVNTVSQQRSGAASRFAAKGMLALGVAVLLIGAGIAIAALGMAEFVKSFAQLEGEQILGAVFGIVAFSGALYMLIPALIALAPASTAASLGMMALGVAVLLMGAGIALAALGMAEFVKAFSALNPFQLIVLGISFYVISSALGVLIPLLMGFAPVASAASLGMMSLGFTALMIGAGLALAGLGISMMVEQLSALAQHGMLAVGVLFGFAAAVVALAGAMALLANPFTMVGMAMMLIALNDMARMAEAQAQMAGETSGMIQTMKELSDDFGEGIQSFVDLGIADFALSFLMLRIGIERALSAFEFESDHGVKVYHSLENLALIATGTSARAMEGTANNISSALERLGNSMDDKQTIKITIDREAVQELVDKAYYECSAE